MCPCSNLKPWIPIGLHGKPSRSPSLAFSVFDNEIQRMAAFLPLPLPKETQLLATDYSGS